MYKIELWGIWSTLG